MSDDLTYVVPDTNFVLHGIPLAGITPQILGISGDVLWLFVRTVVKELDDKSHSQNGRIKTRARAALKAIEAATTGRPGDPDIIRYNPKAPLDYVGMGFDPHDADEKILAEITSYKQEHSGVNTLLLTLDTGMRIKAADHHVAVVTASTDLRAADEEDPTERALRSAQAELAAIKAARPHLVVTFDGRVNEWEIRVFPDLSEQARVAIVEQLAMPETAKLSSHILSMLLLQEDPRYSDKLAKYRTDLHDVVTALWASLGRTATLRLHLDNSGDVEGTDVRVDLAIPRPIVPVRDLPTAPPIPKKPRPVIESPHTPSFLKALGAIPQRATISPSVFRQLASPPTRWGPRLSGDGGVAYWMQTIRQRNSVPLDPLLVVVERLVPQFRVKYEVRASNLVGVERKALTVRVTTIPEEEAVAEVQRTLTPAPSESEDQA